MSTSIERIAIDTVDGPMEAVAATPEGLPRGAIIVVQEAFGITDHIVRITERLADVGYRAIAPALFHRSADPAPVLDYTDYPSALDLLGALSKEGLSVDLDATEAHLREEGFEAASIGIVGFCMGGAVSLFAATRPGVAAAVTFYGGGVSTGRFGLPPLIELAPSLEAPWLGLYGDLDASIPVDDVEQLAAAASHAAVSTEVVRYPDAEHGFNCDDRPHSFNPAAADDAWARTLRFFDEHLLS